MNFFMFRKFKMKNNGVTKEFYISQSGKYTTCLLDQASFLGSSFDSQTIKLNIWSSNQLFHERITFYGVANEGSS